MIMMTTTTGTFIIHKNGTKMTQRRRQRKSDSAAITSRTTRTRTRTTTTTSKYLILLAYVGFFLLFHSMSIAIAVEGSSSGSGSGIPPPRRPPPPPPPPLRRQPPRSQHRQAQNDSDDNKSVSTGSISSSSSTTSLPVSESKKRQQHEKQQEQSQKHSLSAASRLLPKDDFQTTFQRRGEYVGQNTNRPTETGSERTDFKVTTTTTSSSSSSSSRSSPPPPPPPPLRPSKQMQKPPSPTKPSTETDSEKTHDVKILNPSTNQPSAGLDDGTKPRPPVVRGIVAVTAITPTSGNAEREGIDSKLVTRDDNENDNTDAANKDHNRGRDNEDGDDDEDRQTRISVATNYSASKGASVPNRQDTSYGPSDEQYFRLERPSNVEEDEKDLSKKSEKKEADDVEQRITQQQISPSGMTMSHQYYRQQQQQQYLPNQQLPQQQYYYHQQQQQQHQQQQPRQQMLPQQRQLTQARKSSNSMWKTLWGRVESGLDQLADIEDNLAGRAQKYISSSSARVVQISRQTTTMLTSPPTATKHGSRGSTAERSDPRQTGTTATSGGLAALASRSSSRYKSSLTSPSTEPLKPYGQKYQQAKDQGMDKQSSSKASASRGIDWNDLMAGKKMIQANGGASAPPPGQNPGSRPPSPPREVDSAAAATTAAATTTIPQTSQTPQSRPQYQPPTAEAQQQPQRTTGPYSQQPYNQGSNTSPAFRQDGRMASSTSQGQAQAQGQASTPYGQSSLYMQRGAPTSMQNRQTPGIARSPDSNTKMTTTTTSSTSASRIPWDRYPTSSQSSPSSSTVTSQQSRSQHRPSPPRKYDFDDDDDKKPIWKRLLGALPRLPSVRKLFTFWKSKSYHYASIDAWKEEERQEDDDKKGLFGLFRKKSTPDPSLAWYKANESRRQEQNKKNPDAMAPPLANMMARCDNGKTSSLLLPKEERLCRTLGRRQAVFDIVTVWFVLVGLKQIPGLKQLMVPSSLDQLINTFLPKLGDSLTQSVDTWAPFMFAYAMLTVSTGKLIVGQQKKMLENSVSDTVLSESLYSQLFLRLAAAVPLDNHIRERMGQSAASEVSANVETSRLNAFTGVMVLSLIVMTVSFVGPVAMAIMAGLTDLIVLDQWRTWPISWTSLWMGITEIFRSMSHSLQEIIGGSLESFLDHPLKFAFHLSIFASLFLSALIPFVEGNRKSKGTATTTAAAADDDEDDAPLSSVESAQQLSKLGSSSASRLTLLSENGSIEHALERWRSAHTTSTVDPAQGQDDISAVFRQIGYTTLTGLIAIAPIIVFFLVGNVSNGLAPRAFIQWNSALDVSIILLCVYYLVNHTLSDVFQSRTATQRIRGFLTTLTRTLHDIMASNRQQGDNIQFNASVSPTAGIQVTDLWAAHTTKRAWAVRGANLHCRNGEIVLIVGDDSAGKTRFLTSIAESLVSPPRRSLTTNKVRGNITVGGVEGSKWDQRLLKRRLGILLSDVRSLADSASLFSGWTLEEILEPTDGVQIGSGGGITMSSSTTGNGGNHKMGSAEKASIISALKITGLYTSLVPKLPFKLSTVFTADEEDLRPSPLRPRCSVLSPAEWSKVLLTKVIAQTIYDNDNTSASSDKIENCLTGSVLLLDEPTMLLSEVEEAKIIKELRQTRAATILSTNKWSTGRFVDYVIVMNNGSIVEGGTHNELLARGPSQSLYAAKWHAMTTQ